MPLSQSVLSQTGFHHLISVLPEEFIPLSKRIQIIYLPSYIDNKLSIGHWKAYKRAFKRLMSSRSSVYPILTA